MRQFTTIDVEYRRPGIALATLNRPERLNAMTDRMVAEIEQLCADVDTDPGIRVLVLRGAGGAFSSGLDLDDAQALISAPIQTRLTTLHRWSRAITSPSRIGTPVVAAVDGHAAGGGFALALACDIRIATSAARFSAAFIRIGFTGGDMGVSWFLPRIAGLGHASDLMLTGRAVDAEEAARMGVVNRVVPAVELIDTALDYAELLIANDATGVALTKHVLQTNVASSSLTTALDLENRNQAMMAETGTVRRALERFARGRRGR
jgi:enoyl-CoA hydratase/carnithine racemase